MTAADVVGVCDVPAVFNFKANEVYRFYFNGRLMGVSPTNPTAGVSNLKTVSLPRVPQCGDVIGIHSEVRNSASRRAAAGLAVAAALQHPTARLQHRHTGHANREPRDVRRADS